MHEHRKQLFFIKWLLMRSVNKHFTQQVTHATHAKLKSNVNHTYTTTYVHTLNHTS